MEEYLSIIRKTIPTFKEEYLTMPIRNTGVDSIELVIIRVGFEKQFGNIIPDSKWTNFNTLSETIEYCENFGK